VAFSHAANWQVEACIFILHHNAVHGVVGHAGADLVEVCAVGSGAYSGWRGRKTLCQGLPLSAAGERHDAYLCLTAAPMEETLTQLFGRGGRGNLSKEISGHTIPCVPCHQRWHWPPCAGERCRTPNFRLTVIASRWV